MSFVNVGAISRTDNTRFKTKAAFKRACFEDSTQVTIYSTSMFDSLRTTAAQLAQDKDTRSFTVVGPDPERDRKWYATLTINRLGNIKVV